MSDGSPTGPLSRIEWVEGQLRQAILAGDFSPGERLLTVPLAERYAVSPTPLREVLHRFAGEGLVEFVPQKGARVSELTNRDAQELAELRAILDAENLKAAATGLTTESRNAITEASAQLVATWQVDGCHSRQAEVGYRTFYDVASTGNPSRRLREQAAHVRELGSRYRLAAVGLDPSQLVAAHQRVRDAVLHQDLDAICAAVADDAKQFAAAFANYQKRGNVDPSE